MKVLGRKKEVSRVGRLGDNPSRQVLRRALSEDAYLELRSKFGGERRQALRAMALDLSRRKFRQMRPQGELAA